MKKPFYTSKKWWITVLAMALPIVNRKFGLDMQAEEMALVIAPAAGYVAGLFTKGL
jgi:hypothetical protein